MSKNRLIEDVSKVDDILFFSITLNMASVAAWYNSHGYVLSQVGRERLISLKPELVFKKKHNLAIITPLEEEFNDSGSIDFEKVLVRAKEYDLKLPSIDKYPALLSFISSQTCRTRGNYDCVCLIDGLFDCERDIFCATKTFCGRYVLEVHSVSSTKIDIYPSISFLFEKIEWKK